MEEDTKCLYCGEGFVSLDNRRQICYKHKCRQARWRFYKQYRKHNKPKQ